LLTYLFHERRQRHGNHDHPKMAAAAEHKTVKDLLLELIEEKIQDLEKKGLLPKGKG